MNIKEAMAMTEQLVSEFHDSNAAVANRLLYDTIETLDLKGPLEITFGMGHECVTYRTHYANFYMSGKTNGEGAYFQYSPNDMPDDEDGDCIIHELAPLAQALQVAITAVHGYSAGCPEDIHITP